MEEQFESLESAHDFVALLAETVVEAKRELTDDVQREAIPSRRLDALQVALYNLQKLELHVNCTNRILNDLRTLRRPAMPFPAFPSIHVNSVNNCGKRDPLVGIWVGDVTNESPPTSALCLRWHKLGVLPQGGNGGGLGR